MNRSGLVTIVLVNAMVGAALGESLFLELPGWQLLTLALCLWAAGCLTGMVARRLGAVAVCQGCGHLMRPLRICRSCEREIDSLVRRIP